MTFTKRISLIMTCIVLFTFCRSQNNDNQDPAKDLKTSAAKAKAKAPEAPNPVSQPVDISGVPIQSNDIPKTDPGNLIQYRISGNCASTEDSSKVYSTYSTNVSVPLSQSGSCTIEFRQCSDPDKCSNWTPVNFTQNATPPEADKLRALLRQQFDLEQQLQTYAQTISSNMSQAAPFLDQCLSNQKDINVQALKDLADLAPQQISVLLENDFTQQMTDAINQTSTATLTASTTQTPSSTSASSTTSSSTDISSLAESTKITIFQNLSLIGIPVVIFLSVEVGTETFA